MCRRFSKIAERLSSERATSGMLVSKVFSQRFKHKTKRCLFANLSQRLSTTRTNRKIRILQSNNQSLNHKLRGCFLPHGSENLRRVMAHSSALTLFQVRNQN